MHPLPSEPQAVVCAEFLMTVKPFACLVPSELVSWVPVALQPEGSPTVRDALNASRKITFLSASFTWVVYDPAGRLVDQIFGSRAESGGGHVGQLGSSAEWRQEQAEHDKELRLESNYVVVTDDGLLMHAPPGEAARVIVPVSKREALALAAHERICHRGWKKTLQDLRKTFYWKCMGRDVKRLVERCEACVLAKQRRNLAHGQFASREELADPGWLGRWTT